MKFYFECDHAVKYGDREAVMIQHFKYWIEKNKTKRINEHDGRTWTYNSIEAFTKVFTFWSVMQVRRIIDSLVKQAVILKGNYNKAGYDRTTWYAFQDEADFLFTDRLLKLTTPFVKTNKPIPIKIPISSKKNMDEVPHSKIREWKDCLEVLKE